MTWIVYALCLAPIWGSLAWHLYAFRVRPLLVPEQEIGWRVARALGARDPHEAALAEEHAAWIRGDTREQGLWRRVRLVLVRRGD